MKKENSKKIILDLCGGTGAWSKPYVEAGYTVYNITLPQYDVLATRIVENDKKYKCQCFHFRKDTNDNYRLIVPIKKVYGILSAPPCTMFSFARTKAKKPRDLAEGFEIIRVCLNIIWKCMEIKQDTRKKTLPLKFWALENPYHGFLSRFLGKPALVFDPWEYGDAYQKKTALWGYFNEPERKSVKMSKAMKEKAKTNSYFHQRFTKFDYLKSKEIHPEVFGKLTRQERRAITPAGFAKAFFEANK